MKLIIVLNNSKRDSGALRETIKESSSIRENWRDAKRTLGSFGGFSSGGSPSPSFSPSSFTNLGSGSTRYKEDAKDALKLLGAAGASSREALGSWAQSVREGASGWSASGSIFIK